MPIKGLTDRGMSFPEIGIVRKGAPKPTGENRPGRDLKYFRVEFDEKEVEAKEKFLAAYGLEPDEINIIFPFDDIWRIWDAWMEAYTAGRMIARSDGETFSYLVDPDSGEILVKDGLGHNGRPVPYREVIGQSGKTTIKCKPTGRLKVVIPELQRLAYLTVKTTSYYDIINISEQLSAIQGISNGKLAGIPLVLRRRPKQISTPGQDGKRVRREKWLISIEADPEWVKAKLIESKRLALPGNGLDYIEAETVRELPATVVPPAAEDAFDYDDTEDFEDYDETEPTYPSHAAPKADPKPETKATGKQRPYTPAELKAKIEERSKIHATKHAPEIQRNILGKMLKTTFEGDDTKRYEFTKWAAGAASTKDVPDAFVWALFDWMGVSGKDFNEVPCADALTEAKSALTEALKDMGQLELIEENGE